MQTYFVTNIIFLFLNKPCFMKILTHWTEWCYWVQEKEWKPTQNETEHDQAWIKK